MLSNFLSGQAQKVTNIVAANGDTSSWFKYQNIILKDLSLQRLDTATSSFHFRVWKTNQVVELWQANNNTYSGQLTSWVTEHVPKNEKPTSRIFINKKALNTDTIKEIINFIETSRIINLPTDDSIKGWKHGFDGFTYIIEYSTKTSYSLKTYWTPIAQDSTLAEAKYLQSFIDKIFEWSEDNLTWKTFEKTIPFECYNVGSTIRCKVLTKKKKRQLAHEREVYRKQKIKSE